MQDKKSASTDEPKSAGKSTGKNADESDPVVQLSEVRFQPHLAELRDLLLRLSRGVAAGEIRGIVYHVFRPTHGAYSFGTAGDLSPPEVLDVLEQHVFTARLLRFEQSEVSCSCDDSDSDPEDAS